MLVVTGHDLQDGLVLEHVREPVGAQQHDVAGQQVVHRHVEFDLGPHAERLGEDILHDRPDAGVGVGPVAVGERIVAGELQDAPASDQVDATVADVAICKQRLVSPADDNRRDRGAHPGILVLGRGARIDGAVRQLDGRADPVGIEGRARIESVGPGELGIGLRSVDEGSDRVDPDPRGDVSRLVAAHPVTHDENPVADENGVLVPRAPPAHVGAATVLNHLGTPLSHIHRDACRLRADETGLPEFPGPGSSAQPEAARSVQSDSSRR